MNDNFDLLIVMAALALYREKGLVEALAYLISNGRTVDEATDVIALYDIYVEFIKTGREGDFPRFGS